LNLPLNARQTKLFQTAKNAQDELSLARQRAREATRQEAAAAHRQYGGTDDIVINCLMSNPEDEVRFLFFSARVKTKHES